MYPVSVRAAAVISRGILAIPPAYFAYLFLMFEANLRNEWMILQIGFSRPEAAKGILWLRENRWLLFGAAGVFVIFVLRAVLDMRAAWEGREKALRRALERAWVIVISGVILAVLAAFIPPDAHAPASAPLLIGGGVALSLTGFALTRLIHLPKIAPSADASATDRSPLMREARDG